MTDSSSPAVPAKSRAAAVAAACALCAPLVLASEGWVKRAAPDPIGIVTACAGHTGKDVVLGRDYTDAECRSLLASDLAKHGQEIDLCIKVDVPLQSRAAFTSFAFNVGAHAFCASTMDRKLNGGDLPGACAELSKWTFAGGRQLPGLVTRRRNERKLCELGLAIPNPERKPS
jgi:lysozyme